MFTVRTQRARLPAAALAGALLGLAAAAAPARAADVFSPGPLAKGHHDLEGLPNCTKCHAAGEKLSQERCLDCHKEVRARIAEGKGFHGRIPERERACENCHHEHQGRDFHLVDWGPGGERRFDHGKTGYPLKGKHAKLECAACHEPRRVVSAAAKEVASKGRKTYLGLLLACADCHFDEHRSQAVRDCQKCHDERGWKPAPGFDHRKTAYPLEGRHAKVDCAKCHPASTDAAGKQAFPAAVSDRFLRFKPIVHEACTDCHKDPHQNRFGQTCTACHTLDGWKKLKPAGEAVGFHDKTRYPLRGRHIEVSCKACHGPFRGEKQARYKNLAFGACTDCHADAHVGQMGKAGTPAAACDRCHTVDGFQPVRFLLADHAKTRYPLEGGHRTAACALCHPAEAALAKRFPAAVRTSLERQGRQVKLSLVRVDRDIDPARCQACHRDVHDGQFKSRVETGGCQACHQIASFKQLRFDHDRDSRYPLTGKHAKAACASCHKPAPGPKGPVVRYRPIDMACASCHADPHAGQFAAKGANACQGCHATEDWKRTLFSHAPPFTNYRLDGKHAKVDCAKCHPAVAVAKGVEVRRYKGVPTACESCHQDFHRGAFVGVQP